MIEITSTANPRLKAAMALQERRGRSTHFLIEGYRELLRAVEGGVEIVEIFFCPSFFLGSNEEALMRQSKAQNLYQCKENVFEKLSYRDRPDGLIAVAKIHKKGLADLKIALSKSANPFFLIAEGIEKPGNLGTILRSADAAGVDGVIVCDQCTDLYNPNTVRASVGTLFTVPVFEASSEETIGLLKNKNVAILAATPSASSLYTEVPLGGSVALVVGTEQLGLSALWMDEADLRVRIPMKGGADSLNVATATTLLLFEVVRQRGM
ncbi:MAG: RNA methyltransferase [Chlamydiota bacterium]